MTFDEYIKKYTNVGLDTDGAYGNQCMDNMHKYIVDVLGLPLSLFAAPTAYEAYKNANDPRFDKIANTPTGVPQKGDIVFWNTTVGSAGHVAIFIEGNTDTFKSFDQNWNAHQYCEEVVHTYKGVAGWLHFKATEDTQKLLDELRKARDDNWNLYQGEVSKNNELTKQIQDLQQQLQNLREAFDKQTEADSETGRQLIDVSHERDGIKNDFESVASALGVHPVLKDMLTVIDSMKAPQDAVVNHYDKVLEEFWDNLYKTRLKGFMEWLKLGFNLLKNKFK